MSTLKIEVHQSWRPRHRSLATEFGSGSCGDLKDCAHRRAFEGEFSVAASQVRV